MIVLLAIIKTTMSTSAVGVDFAATRAIFNSSQKSCIQLLSQRDPTVREITDNTRKYEHSISFQDSPDRIARSFRIYHDPAVVKLLGISTEQLSRIKDEIVNADQEFTRRKSGDTQNDRELYRTIFDLCSSKLDAILTPKQMSSFQTVRIAWNLTSYSIHILRDPVFDTEFSLSQEQHEKLDGLLVEVVRSAIEENIENDILERQLEKEELANVFLVLREYYKHQEHQLRERVQSLLSHEQSKRLFQLEIQNLVISKGVAAFSLPQVDLELHFTEEQKTSLSTFDSIKMDWVTTKKKIEEFRHFESMLSDVQLARWKNLIGPVHESFREWPSYELLKKDP